MQIYAISTAGQIAKALDLSDRISGSSGDPDDVDYAFSTDWSRITYYTDFPDDPNDQSENAKTHTTSVTYCLKGHKYDKCGHSDNAKMPNPPNFKSPEGPQWLEPWNQGAFVSFDRVAAKQQMTRGP